MAKITKTYFVGLLFAGLIGGLVGGLIGTGIGERNAQRGDNPIVGTWTGTEPDIPGLTPKGTPIKDTFIFQPNGKYSEISALGTEYGDYDTHSGMIVLRPTFEVDTRDGQNIPASGSTINRLNVSGNTLTLSSGGPVVDDTLSEKLTRQD